jgi:hypothetical protein
MFLGMTPFGSFLSGLVAERFGAPSALISGAIVTFVFTLFAFIYRPSRRARQIEVASLPASDGLAARNPS